MATGDPPPDSPPLKPKRPRAGGLAAMSAPAKRPCPDLAAGETLAGWAAMSAALVAPAAVPVTLSPPALLPDPGDRSGDKLMSPSTDSALTRPARAGDLPDEVLVLVFRSVHSASSLARFRGVCRRWRGVIDATPLVWRAASFRGARFAAPVECAKDFPKESACSAQARRMRLRLGERPGRRAVSLAAAAGNEWALFLRAAVFDAVPLRAVTVYQPTASGLVLGTVNALTLPHPPAGAGGWVAVHAARALPAADAGALPRGALVGLVRVRKATCVDSAGAGRPEWAWEIDRHVKLVKPMRCAGFHGLWTLSGCMMELFVRALHMQ